MEWPGDERFALCTRERVEKFVETSNENVRLRSQNQALQERIEELEDGIHSHSMSSHPPGFPDYGRATQEQRRAVCHLCRLIPNAGVPLRLRSQNQALQERIEELESRVMSALDVVTGFYGMVEQHTDADRLRLIGELLSPTQESEGGD
jgi:BMFP domain-containing protein YqiC